MNEIQFYAIVVGAVLFLLVGMEIEILKRKLNKTIVALRETLKELARIYPLD